MSFESWTHVSIHVRFLSCVILLTPRGEGRPEMGRRGEGVRVRPLLLGNVRPTATATITDYRQRLCKDVVTLLLLMRWCLLIQKQIRMKF